jgi:hypothetical protein
LVLGSAGGSLREWAISRLIGFTTKKKMTAAIVTNETTALMNEPYFNVLLLISNVRFEKSCFAKVAAISGVIRSPTSDVTTALKATLSPRRWPGGRRCLGAGTA